MKYIKLYEDFKVKNISIDDIVNCITGNGIIYSTIIKNLPEHDVEEPLKPVSVDEDGLITIERDGKEYEVELKYVKQIEN
jgi:hypothetical protein